MNVIRKYVKLYLLLKTTSPSKHVLLHPYLGFNMSHFADSYPVAAATFKTSMAVLGSTQTAASFIHKDLWMQKLQVPSSTMTDGLNFQ